MPTVLGFLLSSDNVGSFSRLLPSLMKYLLYIVFLLNVRSWPFAWHIRVLTPVFRIRLQYKMVQLRTIFQTRAAQLRAEDRWFDSISPIGANPFTLSSSYKSWAGVDDCDFNGHMSNSSYPKTLDCARFKSALLMFPRYLNAGGWIGLAATHFNFIREIPMFSSFELRMSIGAWEQKWFYVITKFVTKPSSKDKKRQKVAQSPPSAESGTAALFNFSDLTASETTTHSANGTTPPQSTANGHTDDALEAVAKSLASVPEPDGAIVHTVAISRCVFKLGRVTVPPALVFACSGFSMPSPKSGAPYSLDNPPPHWQHVRPVASKPLGGGPKALHAFLKSGWRNIPEDERWWEHALGGVIEEERKKRIEMMQHLAAGMDGVRSL